MADLSRDYFSFAASQKELKPAAAALYFYLLTVCESQKWPEAFSVTARECMSAMGVSSYNTFRKTLDVLLKFGFVSVDQEPCNQHQSYSVTLCRVDWEQCQREPEPEKAEDQEVQKVQQQESRVPKIPVPAKLSRAKRKKKAAMEAKALEQELFPPDEFPPEDLAENPPPLTATQQILADKAKKYNYAEFVRLTRDEYAKLCASYSEEGAKRLIEILDNYKGAKGKRYVSDYRAILNWVVDRYNEELLKTGYGKTISGKAPGNTGQTGGYRDTL